MKSSGSEYGSELNADMGGGRSGACLPLGRRAFRTILKAVFFTGEWRMSLARSVCRGQSRVLKFPTRKSISSTTTCEKFDDETKHACRFRGA